MADYNVRFVPDRNSNSRSLTVLFWDLVILSMDGESNRNSKLSDTLDFLEHFSISNADSTVFFLMCWYFVQWNRKCSAVSLSEPHSQIGLVDVPVLWLSSFSMESWGSNLTYDIPISRSYGNKTGLNGWNYAVGVTCSVIIVPESLPRFQCDISRNFKCCWFRYGIWSWYFISKYLVGNFLRQFICNVVIPSKPVCRVWCRLINWITVDEVTPDSWCSVVVHLEKAWWLIQLLLWNHIICKLYCIYLKTDDHLCIPGQAGWVLNSSSNTTSPGPVIIGLFVVHKRIYN